MLTLTALTAHAQHFDWVKTYTGPDINETETNNIVGHEIEVIDFNSFAFYSHGNQTHIKDSILYFDGTIYSSADFGTILIPSSGSSQVFIAKYVDTSFMTPYVPSDTTHTDPVDTGDVRITLADDGVVLVAYPNPFRQRVTIKVESGELKVENGVATAWLTDMMGRREEVHLTPSGPGQYNLDLTSRPQATYLLTLTTADGKQHTVRLLKQSDIFGN